MQRRRLITTAAIAVLAGSPLAAQSDDDSSISRAELIANSCFACHGEDGQGAGSMPPIAGWDPEIMEDFMKGFRDGKRDPTVMDRHATGYTDEEIREVAEYLSELE
ncbi:MULTISPECIES: c-type cytochrome [Halorhodospira]|uniref:c-type cytochrome n=1 Tax=Halorhodospira TaxID=85108 RepID=UPI0019149CEA|nr:MULTISPECIES: c-type cytochrome [Halorhodospira]MBK5937558.1 cytochrome C [Halorhodospira halophila]MCG5538886.1 c-type cytochrome [Halorhodospira sp. 9622]MCG5541338.1 c-type cytochrome [Halorhodospira sp. M39old]MCG5546906.1 c-type cytochrome [Halorhodospira sp. M38]